MSTPEVSTAPTSQPPQPSKKRRSACLPWLVLAASSIFIWLFCGVFTIQPIGALPDGATLVIWRGAARPLFDSPDKLCLDVQGGVSLLCRAAAIGALKPSQIVLRLPYLEWTYLISTGGRTYSH